jgi:ankyrin repeat protein
MDGTNSTNSTGSANSKFHQDATLPTDDKKGKYQGASISKADVERFTQGSSQGSWIVGDYMHHCEAVDTDTPDSDNDKLLDLLNKAVNNNDETAILKLIEDNPDLVNSKMPASSNTILHVLLEKRNMKNIIFKLIDMSDVHARGSGGYSYLHIACKHKNNHEVINKLLQAGANINAIDVQKKPPIFHAVFAENEDTINLLISLGADLMLTDMFEASLLDNAVSKKNYSIIHTLLKHGLKFKPASNYKHTKNFFEHFLTYAKTINDIELIELIQNTK